MTMGAALHVQDWVAGGSGRSKGRALRAMKRRWR
eukprot:CAMPEP_0196654868 /NCGR_PEP_ID=MMETSP1086-20130531/4611_1 /TAXON_ID=77921 /ORGANISM="Cyanoptyche  gloeocystis , Strain SAG4.97" /LENGTH=33 /DNA_ID= /DNA_START= /DNA_END= /DNA_ORIENTATION=